MENNKSPINLINEQEKAIVNWGTASFSFANLNKIDFNKTIDDYCAELGHFNGSIEISVRVIQPDDDVEEQVPTEQILAEMSNDEVKAYKAAEDAAIKKHFEKK